MYKKLIIYLLVSIFSLLFAHSELSIANYEEHMHEQHDFCVLVQYTIPTKQIVEVVKNINSLEGEPIFEVTNPNSNPFFPCQISHTKRLTNSKPLYIVKQALLI